MESISFNSSNNTSLSLLAANGLGYNNFSNNRSNSLQQPALLQSSHSYQADILSYPQYNNYQNSYINIPSQTNTWQVTQQVSQQISPNQCHQIVLIPIKTTPTTPINQSAVTNAYNNYISSQSIANSSQSISNSSQSNPISNINLINYTTNPTQTISNPSQTQGQSYRQSQTISLPTIPQFPLPLPTQLQSNNYNMNNYTYNPNHIVYSNNKGCIQSPTFNRNINSTNNINGNINGININPLFRITIPSEYNNCNNITNITPNILQDRSKSTPISHTPNSTSETSLPPSISTIPTSPITSTAPITPTTPITHSYSDSSNTKSNIPKAPPLEKSHYKINENGTFQCLIMAKSNKICNKTFAHRSSLTRHKHLVHDNYKPYMCKFKGCLLSFGRLHLLKLHTRVHSGEKPYECPDKFCKKAFKQRAHLTEHIRVHTGEKPYKCSYCGIKFRQKSVLDTHKRRHTGERPFKCKLCGKDFSHYTSFWRHKKNKICIKKKK